MTLTLLTPAVALAVPPGGMAVSRPAPAPARPAARSASSDRTDWDRFRVPFDVDVRPKPLPGSRESSTMNWSPNASWESAAYRREWLAPPNAGYLWYRPAFYQSACPLNNAFAGSPASQAAPADVTIGSLVDKNSENLFSSAPSHTAGMVGTESAATASSPLGLQYSVQATPCGSANFVNF
jgi:hypothetical protein